MKIHDMFLVAEDWESMEVHRSHMARMLSARVGGMFSIFLSPEQAIEWGEALLQAGQSIVEREQEEAE